MENKELKINEKEKMMDYFESYQIQNKFKLADDIEELDVSIPDVLSYLQDLKQQNVLPSKVKKEMNESSQQIQALLLSGFSVLVYGYGSKIQHLQNISQSIQNMEIPVLEFKGFHQSFSLRVFLQHLVKATFTITNEHCPYPHNLSLEELTSRIVQKLKEISKAQEPVVKEHKKTEKNIQQQKKLKRQMILLIIIHNIDCDALMNNQAQQLIADIGNVKGVVILASFDNYLYATKLDYRLIYKMSAVFHVIDTFDVYLKEIETGSLHKEQMKFNQGKGFKWVLDSFNKNQKEIVKIMIQAMLANENGMTFLDLFFKCIEEMLLTKEQQLKDNLVEIVEHNIFSESKQNGKLWYTMTMPKKSMEECLEILMKEQKADG